MTSFLETVVHAFPFSCKKPAEDAAQALIPFVDESYRLRSSIQIVVHGKNLYIPKRLHFIGLHDGNSHIPKPALDYFHCLCTRSTNGYIRQASLQHVLKVNEPWTIPFVILLAGEYVIEIAQEIAASLPVIERDMYINFVRENRPVMRSLRAKAISYWNCYYRHSYPERRDYPGLIFLNQLELWAS